VTYDGNELTPPRPSDDRNKDVTVTPTFDPIQEKCKNLFSRSPHNEERSALDDFTLKSLYSKVEKTTLIMMKRLLVVVLLGLAHGEICPIGPEDSLEKIEADVSDDFIESVVDQVTGYQGGDIMRRYQPQRSWLWRQWSGTILQHGSKSAVINMAVTAIIGSGLAQLPGDQKELLKV
jgi:hypothetical protein